MSDIIYQTQNSNTPSIASSITILVSNPNRKAWMVQNCGTYTLYVLFGNGASATTFNVALKGGTVNDDGNGGIHSQAEGTVYSGAVSGTATILRYVATEIAP